MVRNGNHRLSTPVIDGNRRPSVGTWRVDMAAREIDDGARTRRLSPRATNLLRQLIDADGAVVSRTQLLDAVWPDVTVSEESLTKAVSELRRALDDRSGGRGFIQTVHGSGYRLTAPVTWNDHARPEVRRDGVSSPCCPEWGEAAPAG